MIGYIIFWAVLWAVLSIIALVLRGMVPTTEVFTNAQTRHILVWTAVASLIVTIIVWLIRLV